MIDRLRRTLAAAQRVPARIRRRIRDARRNRERNEKQEREARQRRDALDKRIDEKVKKQTAYVKEHGEPNSELADELSKLRDERAKERDRRERFAQGVHNARQRIDKLRRRLRWAVAKRTTLRRKLKRARAQQTPRWESWMANGANAYVTDAVKAEAAIGVVRFGLAVTSMYRATVIPNSNPNSYHGPNVRPGRAADLAGARMGDYQRDIFIRRRGNCAEMFGPDNSANLKYGAPYYLPEGTFLENLHDSHTHVAP